MPSEVYYSPFIPTFSGNGLPVANARLYFFYTGTTLLAPIYSDAAMTTPMANPVISDGAARYPNIYLNSALIYRVRETGPTGTPLAADIDPYYPGQAAVVVPDLPEFAAPDGASLVGWRQQSADAVNRTVETKLYEGISVQDFDAAGDGTTDDSPAFQAAIDAADVVPPLAYASIFIPPGKYRLVGQVVLKDFVRLYGAGDQSQLYFDPASSGDIMLLGQNANSTQVIKFLALEDFSIIANPASTAKVKTALKLIDATIVTIRNVNFTDYSWTDATFASKGFHLCGRDQHTVENCYVAADIPRYVGLNPNSPKYQFDSHVFRGCTWHALAPGGTAGTGYGTIFIAGSVPTNWLEEGCDQVSGNGGIYLNNQGTVVTETPSQIHISMFRPEGGEANGTGVGGGYGIYMDFGTGNPNLSNLTLNEVSVNDPSTGGFLLKGISSVSVRNLNCGFVSMAFPANVAFIIDRVNQLEIFSLGIGSNTATVTITGMKARYLNKLSGAVAADKSIASALYIAGTALPAANLSYKNDLRDWSGPITLSNGESVTLPALTAEQSMRVRVSCDGGGADWNLSFTASDLISSAGSATFTDDDTGDVTVISSGAGVNTFKNRALGASKIFNIVTEGP